MSPELREFVLSLPLDVRLELAKCDGPWWRVETLLPEFNELLEVQTEPVSTGLSFDGRTIHSAYLPVSPIAIALHAAKLSGRDGSHFVSLTVCPCFWDDVSWAELGGAQSPRDKSEVRVTHNFDGDGAKDPTGHRAAIALLQKVMDERKVPNAEP